MAKRMFIMVLAMAAFLGTIGWVKFRQIKAASQSGSFQPPPEAVTTVIARQELWEEAINAIGSVEAVNGVTVSADLPGVVQTITFESGDRVAAGAVLVQLDTRQEQAQLAAAEAKLELAGLNLDRVKGLREQGINSAADHDTAVAEHRQAQAIAAEIRAVIDRKTIRAPFSGFLGIRLANLGQYLRSGDPIVSLQALDPIYVKFDIPQQEIGRLHAGGEVRVSAEGFQGGEIKGRINAVDSIVNEATRNVRVQATVANPRGRLHPGMFVTARVILGSKEPVIALPTSSISYAPYGDAVFLVQDITGPDGKTYRGVHQQFVKLGGARGDQIAVLSGVEAGAEVVTSGVFKLRNGAAVLVNNDVQPGNDPAPTPEDN